jgi:SAM-dependent methyltransferase
LPFLILSVITSAFCLFLVQPLLAKQVLPWFGGTASVWAVCMVFYQAALLGGYLYAHALTRWLKPRGQALTHLALVGLSLLTLPVGVAKLGRPEPGQGHPEWQIVWLLLVAVGGPYFVLSSTSPLMQAWYARLEPGGKAYRLFGWSNLACALALLSFPFVLEPWVGLSRLNRYWSWGFGVVACLLASAALVVMRRNPEAEHQEASTAEPPGWRQQALWLFFSALGSVILLSVTNHLCQRVAPIPFLWTVPLLLYLLTFAACFEREWYTQWRVMPLAGAALVGMAWALAYLPPGRMLRIGIPIFAAGCFFGCFYCHGELAARKPLAAHLTQFYIVMAAGGALGSLLVAFGAPMVFTGYAELPVALSLCAVAMLFSVYRRSPATDILATVCAVAVTALAFGSLMNPEARVDAKRNFYGSLKVEDLPAMDGRPAQRRIVHGAIMHGSQFLDPNWSGKPTTYYGPNSGAGVYLRHTGGARKVGVIGLGAGTLAAYGREGDRFRFYEINPVVVDYARRHFSYLSGTRARVEVATGDGRLLLESEPDQNFDLLVVDAFSGDSIPIHLLTREAFALYLRHLGPGGVLALHLSNLYLNLQPVVRTLAGAVGRMSVPVVDSGNVREGAGLSWWALVGRREDLARLPVNLGAQLEPKRSPRLWTDDFSTLLAALYTNLD